MAKKAKNGKKILVIDDSVADREIFKVMLKSEGYDVTTVPGVREAFSVLYDEKFDLILCDYFMPEINGEDFLIKLRKDAKLKDYIVIIITSDESKEVKVKLINSGADDFLHKGAAYEEIMARINTHIKAKELESGNNGNSRLDELKLAVDGLKKRINKLNNKKDQADCLKLVNSVISILKKMK